MITYTPTTCLKRVQYDPPLKGAVIVTAFFETCLVNTEDPTDTAIKPQESVTFELPPEVAETIAQLAEKTREVVRAGKTQG